MLALLGAGCLPNAQPVGAFGADISYDHGAGAGASAHYGYYGVQLGADVSLRSYQHTNDSDTHLGPGADLSVRASVLQIARQPDHWIDFGADGGVGGGLAFSPSFTGVGRVWVGGWVDIGLSRDDQAFPVIELQVQHDDETTVWRDQTMFTAGVSWKWRGSLRSAPPPVDPTDPVN